MWGRMIEILGIRHVYEPLFILNTDRKLTSRTVKLHDQIIV
jgi:hypothetical protein